MPEGKSGEADVGSDLLISSVDRDALKMMFAELVDLSIPLEDQRSFCLGSLQATMV